MEEKKFIPVCEPKLEGNELAYITDAVQTGWISSSGKYVKKFEEEFAKYCGVRHGISVVNGTAAIHLALLALGIKEGDEIIMPNFTMIGSAFPVKYIGAKPVFVDSETETWNIDPKKIEEKITDKTKAIMVVHIYGHPCDMNPIIEIAKKYNLKVIEDAAEAHGAEYNGRRCGSLGDIACFSFYANKMITTGEGGMVVTNDDNLARKCRYYKNLCFPLDGSRTYFHEEIGFNYRMSNVIAAIGLAQLEKIDEFIESRRRNNILYRYFLKDVEGITFQDEKENSTNVYWMNGIVINPEKIGFDRDKFMSRLLIKGVDTRLFFVGMNKQPSLNRDGLQDKSAYPVSDYLSENGFYLPSGSNLKTDDIKYVCDKIKEVIADIRKI